MKSIITILTLFVGALSVHGQSVDKLLIQIMDTYSHLENYVDEGEFTIHFLDRKNGQTFHYLLAMDSKKNVNHQFEETSSSFPHAYHFFKTSNENEGLLSGAYISTEPFSCTMMQASAYLGGGGNGMFMELASLMYPYEFARTEYPTAPYTFINRFSDIELLQDTTLENELCYVLKMTSKIELTQEQIDKTRKFMDSMNYVKALEKYPNADIEAFKGSSNYDEKPGIKTAVNKYFVRKKDYMIIRSDVLSFNGNEPFYRLRYKLNPRLNVSHFEQYMTHE